MAEPSTHPLLDAVAPLLARIDAEVVEPAQLRKDDVPLVWEGEVVAGVRLAPVGEPADVGSGSEASGGDLGALIDEVAGEIGTPLAELSRADKQRAVRVLEERGAFAYRRSAETIAEAIGVSRFTVYNYLNRTR
ncbi:helix-turn-helix domain-containing protein [Nocardioides jensenii]|uniref:helix-turn-helix domain-containing protein n=1 Tax=Nocardioides jensenii TaxID=1843 RepID=UPI00083416CD|nr:helix-turn-helix domain-containing protein [Nocardioides jensenii]